MSPMQRLQFVSGALLSALLVALAVPAAAQSQITTGVLTATVVDSSGGVLPGADVEVRNVDTNVTRTFVTGQDGRFAALQLQPGRYTVTFRLTGFSTLVQENIEVTVGETVRLNPVMKRSSLPQPLPTPPTSPTLDT